MNKHSEFPSSESIREAFRRRGLPSYMEDGLIRYYEKGIRPGSFLESVLSNDLFGAVNSADIENLNAIPEWVVFIYNDLPNATWGSPSTVYLWSEHCGLGGI